jgi:glycosyltransferase involved in cell wall biosynthesis
VNLVGSKHGQELENFYKNSNYLLQISSYEGMPHTILEAMNHKLVIIASNFGGNYELIGENIHGYLVESIKENDIVSAIKIAVDDIDKESKVIKAKELIEKEYDIKSTIKNYSEVILKND